MKDVMIGEIVILKIFHNILELCKLEYLNTCKLFYPLNRKKKLKAENLELRKELELLKKFQAFLKKKST